MILAVDTSTQWIGLSLYEESRTLAEWGWFSRGHHTVELAPSIQGLLSRCGVEPSSLDVLAIAIGPGSFTSLRIGLSVVKGMALALHIPVIGVPTLDFTAASQPVQDLPLVAILQAGRSRIAAGWYQAENGEWQAQGEPILMTADELAKMIRTPTLVCGELTGEQRQSLQRKYKNVLMTPPAQSTRRAAFLAEMAWKRWKQGRVDDPVTLSPIYLHTIDAIPASSSRYFIIN
jgi:tRNA threonylcarbamoyladenosine biosynthesis protein TsaB